MFVYIARIKFSNGDTIILGVGETEKKAQEICERDITQIKGKEIDGDWEKKWGYYNTLKRADGVEYYISDWVLEGGE